MTNELKRICFAIMPFDSSFDDISNIIAASSEECELKYVRGDHRNQPGSVMPQIIDDIRNSAVIVADVTGHNPNVFYELGIAHQIKGPGQVVLITQSTDRSPFDVNEFRQIRYTHSEAGRAELRKRLPASLLEALLSRNDGEVWSITRGPMERTRLIVRDLRRHLTPDARADVKNLTIRMIAGLGSLAISNLEAPDPELGHEYNDALREERDLLCEALVMGAKLKALLHPPRRFTRRMLDERLKSRYERLIGLLEGRSDFAGDTAHVEADLKAMKRCEFLVTPVPMPHLFVIGNQVAYEGMKRGGSRGYAMTHCETDLQAVQKIIEDFDMHFAECRELQGNTHAQGNSVAVQLKAFLREAMQAI